MTPQTIIAHKPRFYRHRRLLQGFFPLHQSCFKYWVSAFFCCLFHSLIFFALYFLTFRNPRLYWWAVAKDQWATLFLCSNLSLPGPEFHQNKNKKIIKICLCSELSVSVPEFHQIPSVSNSWAAGMANIHQDNRGCKTIQQQDDTKEINAICNLKTCIHLSLKTECSFYYLIEILTGRFQ